MLELRYEIGTNYGVWFCGDYMGKVRQAGIHGWVWTPSFPMPLGYLEAPSLDDLTRKIEAKLGEIGYVHRRDITEWTYKCTFCGKLYNHSKQRNYLWCTFWDCGTDIAPLVLLKSQPEAEGKYEP